MFELSFLPVLSARLPVAVARAKGPGEGYAIFVCSVAELGCSFLSSILTLDKAAFFKCERAVDPYSLKLLSLDELVGSLILYLVPVLRGVYNS